MSDEATVISPQLPVLADPAATETAKLRTFAESPDREIAGHKLKPFSAMRKAMLQLTGNELLKMEAHVKEYCRANNREPPKESDADYADVLAAAVPQASFQMTALAFICVSDSKTLGRVSAKPELFREAVTEFWDTINDDQWQALTTAAFEELARSNTTDDFKVKDESRGAPQPKN